MSSEDGFKEAVALFSAIVAWVILYWWGSAWVWTHFPASAKDAWWYFPAIGTTIALVGSPLAILAWLDCYFGWSD